MAKIERWISTTKTGKFYLCMPCFIDGRRNMFRKTYLTLEEAKSKKKELLTPENCKMISDQTKHRIDVLFD